MRVLFTWTVGYGHFHPMVPLAAALAEAGHEVAFAGPGQLAPRVEAVGFRAFAAGLDPPDIAARGRRRFPEAAAIPPEESLRFYLVDMNAAVITPAMVADLAPLVGRWGPDLVV
ncbi:MAG: glycosyltransferase, partial [Actinobacteria bacterium]|nr:glycosyltransferase [Actinomycetota bacterium]